MQPSPPPLSSDLTDTPEARAAAKEAAIQSEAAGFVTFQRRLTLAAGPDGWDENPFAVDPATGRELTFDEQIAVAEGILREKFEGCDDVPVSSWHRLRYPANPAHAGLSLVGESVHDPVRGWVTKTVDGAVFTDSADGELCSVLIERWDSPGLWAITGGFVDERLVVRFSGHHDDIDFSDPEIAAVFMELDQEVTLTPVEATGDRAWPGVTTMGLAGRYYALTSAGGKRNDKAVFTMFIEHDEGRDLELEAKSDAARAFVIPTRDVLAQILADPKKFYSNHALQEFVALEVFANRLEEAFAQRPEVFAKDRRLANIRRQLHELEPLRREIQRQHPDIKRALEMRNATLEEALEGTSISKADLTDPIRNLPMAARVTPELLAAPRTSFEGEVARHSALGSRALAGSVVAGRWTMPGVPAIYLAGSRDTAVHEAHRHGVNPTPDSPHELFTLNAQVEGVLDLRPEHATDATRAAVAAAGLTLEDFYSPVDRHTACQRFSDAARAAGFTGIIAPSASRTGYTATLFTDRVDLQTALQPKPGPRETWTSLPELPSPPTRSSTPPGPGQGQGPDNDHDRGPEGESGPPSGGSPHRPQPRTGPGGGGAPRPAEAEHGPRPVVPSAVGRAAPTPAPLPTPHTQPSPVEPDRGQAKAGRVSTGATPASETLASEKHDPGARKKVMPGAAGHARRRTSGRASRVVSSLPPRASRAARSTQAGPSTGTNTRTGPALPVASASSQAAIASSRPTTSPRTATSSRGQTLGRNGSPQTGSPQTGRAGSPQGRPVQTTPSVRRASTSTGRPAGTDRLALHRPSPRVNGTPGAGGGTPGPGR